MIGGKMSENLYKDRIVSMIQREIEETEREINNINDIVKRDIERLLSEHIQDIKEGDKEEFEKKHFKSLKDQKLESLQSAL